MTSFIQIYNADQDPIFMEVNSCQALWTLPKKSDIKWVTHVTHIADNGQYYYEATSNGEVTWSLPALSKVAQETMKTINTSDRAACEKKARKPYDAQATVNQINSLDAYLDNKESFVFEDEEAAGEHKGAPATASTASSAAADDHHSDDESKASATSKISLKSAEMIKKTVVKVRLPP